MGFLDQSTNNIIVDAVLTDKGRQALSRNDGSFSIVKFAFTDEEVDYTIVKQFGRTVGKEKIIKNTPVMEAQTHANLAISHKLLGVSNPTLIRLPSLSLSTTSDQLAMTRGQIGTSNTKSVTWEQDIKNENIIDPELTDQSFIVTCNDQFIKLAKKGRLVPPQSLDQDQMATYLLTRDNETTSKRGSRLTLQIQTRSITDAQYTTFGNTSNKEIITTYIQVTGTASGAQKTLEVQISKS